MHDAARSKTTHGTCTARPTVMSVEMPSSVPIQHLMHAPLVTRPIALTSQLHCQYHF